AKRSADAPGRQQAIRRAARVVSSNQSVGNHRAATDWRPRRKGSRIEAAAMTSRACMGLSRGLNTEAQFTSCRGKDDELAPLREHCDHARIRTHRARNLTVLCRKPQRLRAIEKMHAQDLAIKRGQARTITARRMALC